MEKLKSKIESLLFVSTKEMSLKDLVKYTGVKAKEVELALEQMLKTDQEELGGIILLENNGKYKLGSNPENAEIIQQMIRDERTGELTPASLETLTVVAYRGPMSQFELEQIRGVSCTMILRNLLIKGLIEKAGKSQSGETLYQISFDFLEYLGVSKVEDLPNYENLRHDQNLAEFLENKE